MSPHSTLEEIKLRVGILFGSSPEACHQIACRILAWTAERAVDPEGLPPGDFASIAGRAKLDFEATGPWGEVEDDESPGAGGQDARDATYEAGDMGGFDR